jgi:hypothetical protein
MDDLLDACCIRRLGLAPYVQHNFTCHQFANRKRFILKNNTKLRKIEKLSYSGPTFEAARVVTPYH